MTNSEYDSFFSDIYEKNFNRVVKYLVRVVKDFSLAEDLAHDLFFKFYQKRIRPDGDPQRIGNYIMKSAKNRALDYMRSEKRREERLSRQIVEISAIDDAFLTEVENSYICGEIISTVEDVLIDFPDRTRRVFMDMVQGKKLIDVSGEQSMTRYRTKKDYEMVCRIMRDRLKIYYHE